MPEAAFVISARQDEAVREFSETLIDELARQDVVGSLHVGCFPEPREGLVHVVVDPADFVALEGEEALPDRAVLRRTVFISRDEPLRGRDDPRLRLLRQAGAVFLTDQLAVAAAHRFGVHGRLLRAGYSPLRDRYDPDAARPIDVMFVARRSPRRLEALRRLAPTLARHNCLVSVSPEYAITGPASSYLGSSRWPLLAQAKIVMLIHAEPDRRRLDWDAAIDAIHAGAVVVSEQASGIAPLEAGEHLLVSSLDSLGFIVDRLVRDDTRLAELRDRAYERLHGWIPYALPVSTLRAAIVELVGEPVPGPSSSSRGWRGLLARASGDRRPQPAHRAGETTGDPAPEGSAAEAGDANGGAPVDRALAESALQWESPAWSASRGRRVSVLMHAVGPSAAVRLTLTSLLAADSQDYEVIVVLQDADSETARTVRTWAQAHPRVPCLVLLAGQATPGRARNAGLARARGEYLLVLEPGQELYPRGLGRLAPSLGTTPDIVVAYPIVEIDEDPEGFSAAGGEPLLGYLGWDPSCLADRDPIFAPYLVRSSALRALGGFTDDPRLAGFEDWDLWCCMAGRGWRAQLVPQILARRPGSPHAPELSRLRAAAGEVLTGLREHAPTVVR